MLDHLAGRPARAAWRCTVGNEIFALAEEKVIGCRADPVTGAPGFKLNLTEPLPEPDAPATATNNGWLIELADGTISNLATGVGDEKRINYLCSEEDIVILSDLEPGPVWMAEKAIVSFTV